MASSLYLNYSKHLKVKYFTKILIRFLDIFFAIFGIVLFLPIFIIIGLAIFIEDRKNIFFIQLRVGQNLKKFKIIKFRTMFVDENRNLGEVKINNKATLNKLRKEYITTKKSDSRITRIGKILRSTHLDELPQLFNVVIGSMSLVGVRPDALIQEADYTKELWVDRHFLKPGITGLSQIKDDLESINERISLDIYWVKNYSVSLYFYTLIQTIRKIFKMSSY